LLSSVRASNQQQVVQHQQQQQQQQEDKPAFASSLLAGLKGDVDSSGAAGLKPDPGFGGAKIEMSALNTVSWQLCSLSVKVYWLLY
jgi:hypothetical protein